MATQSLQRLDALILPSDGPGPIGSLKLAVAAYITAVMNNQQPTTSQALVIYAPMSYAANDAGSKAKDAIATCQVPVYEGWYTLGQYAQASEINGPGSAFRKNPGSYHGIMIKETENVQPGSTLQRPSSLHRTWGMTKKRMGSFEMGTLPGFASLGSIFLETYQASLQDFASATLVSIDILIPAGYRRMWTDHGSGSRDSDSIWAITVIDDTAGSGGAGVMQKSPAEPSWLFHSTEEYDPPSMQAYQLDFTKVTVVTNNFLSDVRIPSSF